MAEKDIERALVRTVCEYGFVGTQVEAFPPPRDMEGRRIPVMRLLKFVSPGNPGVPDRILIHHQHGMAFMEMKTPTGVLSSEQHREIARLRAMGVHVYIIDNVREGKELIASIARGEWPSQLRHTLTLDNTPN